MYSGSELEFVYEIDIMKAVERLTDPLLYFIYSNDGWVDAEKIKNHLVGLNQGQPYEFGDKQVDLNDDIVGFLVEWNAYQSKILAYRHGEKVFAAPMEQTPAFKPY